MPKITAAIALVILAAILAAPAHAGFFDLDRDTYGGGLKGIERDTQKLVSAVGAFMQMRGRWPPSGPDMQLCQALNLFQQQLGQTARDASSGRPYPVIQQDLYQLQSAGNTVDQMLASAGVTPDVTQRWWRVKSGLAGFAQAFFSGGPFPGPPINAWGPTPAVSPPGPAVADAAARLDESGQQLVNAVQYALQRRLRWPPPPASSDMQLCSLLKTFRDQTQRLRRDAHNRMPLATIAPEVMSLMSSAANIERILPATQVEGDVTNHWWNVRNGLNSLNQLTMAGGYTPWRRW